MEEIRTLAGKFNYEDNTFTTVEGETINCFAYRHHSQYLDGSNLCVVNIKYIKDYVNAWVICQAVRLD